MGELQGVFHSRNEYSKCHGKAYDTRIIKRSTESENPRSQPIGGSLVFHYLAYLTFLSLIFLCRGEFAFYFCVVCRESKTSISHNYCNHFGNFTLRTHTN